MLPRNNVFVLFLGMCEMFICKKRSKTRITFFESFFIHSVILFYIFMKDVILYRQKYDDVLRYLNF